MVLATSKNNTLNVSKPQKLVFDYNYEGVSPGCQSPTTTNANTNGPSSMMQV
jgi:hypothetical protein